MPNGNILRTFKFDVVSSSCYKQIFSQPSAWADQIYYITDDYAEYKFPVFPKSMPECTEKFENSISPTNTWITGVSDFGGEGNVVGWHSIDELNVGIYTIEIRVKD